MTVYVGAVAPESIEVTVRQGLSDLDLSTVSAASFSVELPDRSLTTWSATISGQTATQLTLTHTFAAPDVPSSGRYVLVPILTVPGGTHRANRITITAEDPHRG